MRGGALLRLRLLILLPPHSPHPQEHRATHHSDFEKHPHHVHHTRHHHHNGHGEHTEAANARHAATVHKLDGAAAIAIGTVTAVEFDRDAGGGVAEVPDDGDVENKKLGFLGALGEHFENLQKFAKVIVNFYQSASLGRRRARVAAAAAAGD